MGLRFFFRYLSGKNLETLRSKESIIICLFAYFCRKRMISVAIVRQNVSELSPKDCITLRHRVNSWEKLSDPSTKLSERTSVRIILGPFKGKEKRRKRQNFLTFDGPKCAAPHLPPKNVSSCTSAILENRLVTKKEGLGRLQVRNASRKM